MYGVSRMSWVAPGQHDWPYPGAGKTGPGLQRHVIAECDGGASMTDPLAAAVERLDRAVQAVPATVVSALNGWRLVNPEHDPGDPDSQETYSLPEWLIRASVRAGRAEAMASAAFEAVKALAAIQPGLDPQEVVALIERRVDTALFTQ